MKNFVLIWIATLSLSLPSFAQSAQKRPTTLPTKTVKSQTQFEEPPTVTTAAKAPSPSQSDAEPPDRLSTDANVNSPENEIFYRRPEGYPQQQIAVFYEPIWFRSKWSFHDTEFKFDPMASNSFGLSYRYLISPAMLAEILYQHFSLKVDSDAGNGFTLKDSKKDFDSILARFEYSWIGAKRYFYSYGLGLEIGQDSYPTLNFADASTLELEQARDLVIGLSVQSQLFLLQPFSYKFKVGYDHGFNMEHMGGPATKKNQGYYANVGLEYMINEQSSLTADAEYRVRNTTNSGKRGTEEVEWDTDTSQTIFKIGYVYTFR